MWKDAVRALETGTLAEIGLVAFFIAFLLIVAYALMLPKRDCEDALNMPLDDGESVGAGPVGGDGVSSPHAPPLRCAHLPLLPELSLLMSTDPNTNRSGDAPPESAEQGSTLYGRTHDQLIQGHRYDGIKEYDNPMPGWWVWLLWVCVAYSVVYFVGITWFDFVDSYEDDLAQSQEALEMQRTAYAKANPSFQPTPANLATFVENADRVAAGEATYQSLCASCHGDKGQGVIGPNLTDNYWIHGGSNTDIYTNSDRRRRGEGHARLGRQPPPRGARRAGRLHPVDSGHGSGRSESPGGRTRRVKRSRQLRTTSVAHNMLNMGGRRASRRRLHPLVGAPRTSAGSGITPEPAFVMPGPAFVMPEPAFVMPEPAFVTPEPRFVLRNRHSNVCAPGTTCSCICKAS